MEYEGTSGDSSPFLLGKKGKRPAAPEGGIGLATVKRLEKMQTVPAEDSLEKFYAYAYGNSVRLNRIKEQFYREELGQDEKLLFHGAKTVINGKIRPDVSRQNNDFGQGFYMGESFRQAALFVANFGTSCVYAVKIQRQGTHKSLLLSGY